MPHCKRCGTEISTEAYACPECGWEPRNRGHLYGTALLGGLLCLTGVGAVIGIPMIIGVSYLVHTRREDRPYEVAPA